MFRSTKAVAVIGLAISGLQPIAGRASTPVTVVNTTPIPSVITNTSGNPVQAKIISSTSSPVITKAGDAPALSPAQFEISWFSGTTSGFTETASFTVAAGKQYVIEGISCEAYAPSSTDVIIKLTTTAGGTTLTHYVTGFKSSLVFVDYWLLGIIPTTIYADAGSTVTLDVVRQHPAGASIGYYSDVILSGHYVTIPGPVAK